MKLTAGFQGASAVITAELEHPPQDLGHVLELRHLVFPEVKHRERALVLLAGVGGVQLAQLPQHGGPHASLLWGVLQVGNGAAPAEHPAWMPDVMWCDGSSNLVRADRTSLLAQGAACAETQAQASTERHVLVCCLLPGSDNSAE